MNRTIVSVGLPVLLAVLVFTPAASAQEDSAPPPTLPKCVTALGPAAECCLYVGDLFPIAQGLIDERAIAWWNDRASSFKGLVPPLDPTTAIGRLNQVQGFWPRSVAIGASTALAETTPIGMQILVDFILALEAMAVDQPAFAREVLSDLVAQIPLVERGHAAIAFEFRDSSVPALASSVLLAQAEQLRQLPGCELTRTDSTLDVTISPRPFLASFGLDPLETLRPIFEWSEHDGFTELGDRVDAWRWRVRMRVDGALLVIRVGSELDAPPPSELRPDLFAGHHIAARWDLGQSVDVAARVSSKWKEWSRTPVGQAAVADDEENFFADVADFHATLQRSALRGEAGAILGKVSRLVLHERGITASQEPIRTSVAARAIPDGCDWRAVDGTATLTDRVIDAIRDVEERVARRELQAELRNDPERTTELFDRYFRHTYDTLRTAVVGAFGLPWSVAVDGFSDLDPIDLSVGGTELVLRELPLPRMIVVAPMRDSARARDVIPAVARAILETAGTKLGEEPLAITRDLGLGVTAHVLRHVPAEQDDDRVLHWFESNGHWFASTSVSLSRTSLARLASTEATEDVPDLVLRVENPKPMLLELLTELSQCVAATLPEVDDSLTSTLSACVSLIADFDVRATRSGSDRTTTFRLELGWPSDRPAEPGSEK